MRLALACWFASGCVVASAAPPEPPDLFDLDVGPHTRLEVRDDTDRHDQWDQLDKVTVRLVKDGKTVWTKHGWTGLTGMADRAMPAGFRAATCKLFDLHVFPQKLDRRDGVRLSLACKNQDMTHLDHEVEVSTDILLDTADPYHVIYIGDGDAYDGRDPCDVLRAVSYALTGTKLAITTTERRGTSCANPGSSASTKTVTL